MKWKYEDNNIKKYKSTKDNKERTENKTKNTR